MTFYRLYRMYRTWGYSHLVALRNAWRKTMEQAAITTGCSGDCNQGRNCTCRRANHARV